MAALQNWSRQLDADSSTLATGQDIDARAAVESLSNVDVRSLLNNKAVNVAMRKLCSSPHLSTDDADRLSEAFKQMFMHASVAYKVAQKVKPPPSRTEAIRDIRTASSQARALASALKGLKRIPAGSYGLEHLKKRASVPAPSSSLRFSSGWASANRAEGPGTVELLRALSAELAEQADFLEQSMTAEPRQTRGKQNSQTNALKNLQKHVASIFNPPSPGCSRPDHELIHAILKCIWGSDALSRSHISRTASDC
jgi:hypothetical protein